MGRGKDEGRRALTEVELPYVPLAAVERAIETRGLVVATRSTLSKYPGCVHWHLRRCGQKGTLELTHWFSSGRLWFNIHPLQAAAWMPDEIEAIRKDLQRVADG